MENAQNDIFYKVAQWCLLALAFLLPIWFLPNTIAPVEFNKVMLVSLLVFVSFILYLAHIVKSGKVALPYHRFFIVVGILLLSWLVSALVSRSGQAFWGVGAETTSFFNILTLFLLSFLVMELFNSKQVLTRLFIAWGLGFILLLAMTWLFSVFGLGTFLGGLFAARSFNTIGSWNSVAFAAGFFVMMLYPFALSAQGRLKWLIFSLILISVLLMLVVNFTMPWLVIGIFAILLLSYAIWRRNTSPLGMGLPMLLLLVSLFGFYFNDVIAGWTAFPAPIEVGVSHLTTLKVASESLKENLLFGLGPTSFGLAWDKFKPIDVNRTLFWGLRFNSGSSYILTWLAEIGLLGWLAFVIFLAFLWYLGLKVLAFVEPGTETLILASFLLFTYTILVWSVYAGGYTLTVFGFLVIGILLAAMRGSGFFKNYEFSFFTEGPKGFISALLAVFLMIVGIGGLYVSGIRYFGQVVFAKGLNAFNRDNNMENAERYFLLAARSDKYNDNYFRTISQLYLVRAQLLLRDPSTPQELLGSKFKDALDKSVASAQSAGRASPRDFTNYRALGKVYELLIQLNAAGSLEAAISQYDEALKYSPKNPALWRDKAAAYLADVSVRRNQESLKKAEEALLKAVELKPDYTEGHFVLAQVYDALGKREEAIRRGEAAALLAPEDIGTLFQLGLLYYRSNKFADAEVVLKRAVDINNNFSNARYFLGLIYDRTRRRQAAIEEFDRIAALNPGNDEVEKILANLRGGREVLAGIVPPEPSPEKRKEPPVRDTDTDSSIKPKKRR